MTGVVEVGIGVEVVRRIVVVVGLVPRVASKFVAVSTGSNLVSSKDSVLLIQASINSS